MLFLVIYLIFNIIPMEHAMLPSIVKIGAIFLEEQRNTSVEFAFKYAVHRINSDRTLLHRSRLVYDTHIIYVKRGDSFHMHRKVCTLLETGVQALFGPSDPVLGAHVRSICDTLHIPHFESSLDIDNNQKQFSVNLHPPAKLLQRAFQDVMMFLNWTKVAAIYETDTGFLKLRDLYNIQNDKRTLDVLIRQADANTFLDALQDIKSKETYNIVVDTTAGNMQHFLRAILKLQMNDFKYHYLFTTLDLESFNLEDFKYNFVNMTAFRIVDIEDIATREILRDMERYHPRMHLDHSTASTAIQAEPAFMYDAVYMLALGLQSLEQSSYKPYYNISCSTERPWNGGFPLLNYINSAEIKGLSGPVVLEKGQRVHFSLDLLKLKQHALVKVGEWSPATSVNITDREAFFDSTGMNVTLVVITILEIPYVMMHYEKNYTGNERFYGFCVDVLDRLAKKIGFDYILDLVPDRKYGAQDPVTGEWNGMVSQLMKHKADLAVGSMTINYARESVIDFTKPFMNLGISILFKVIKSEPNRLFSFMNPLAVDIWLYVLTAYVFVSITMFAVSRFSPSEWETPSFKTDESVSQFSLANSFWFTIGTLMQQGSDLNPKATSTRLVGGIWWFFTLIIIASYTANLAAFLTVERMITPIENAEDLADQTEISYGTLDSGSTMTFFRDSMIETYKKMWRFMENKKPSVFVSTYEEGIKRVKEGNYAFLMESTMLDYIVQRDCNLTQIGGLLDTKGYGIATPMGSPWRDKISLAILELQEKGEMQYLYDKWWKNSGDICTKPAKGKESKANALGVSNIGGIFIVLLCGLAFAILVAIGEFLCNAEKEDYDSLNFHQSLCEEMGSELCFALRCQGAQRKKTLRRQCSKCIESTMNIPTNNKL